MAIVEKADDEKWLGTVTSSRFVGIMDEDSHPSFQISKYKNIVNELGHLTKN